LLKRIAALATIPLVTSGCAGLPVSTDATTMTLRVSAAALAGPYASVSGDSDMAPGKAAKAVLPPADACTDIMALFCAIFIPIVVPAAAVVGAVTKTSQKLPLEQAVELNRVTADVMSQLDLDASFRSALATEARRRGITLSVPNSDTDVFVEPHAMSWDINVGNQVALRMEVDITVVAGRERGSSDLVYRSELEPVAFWIADDGRPIRQSLEEAMVGASRAIWNRVLGPE
jgi:hypothetical protein